MTLTTLAAINTTATVADPRAATPAEVDTLLARISRDLHRVGDVLEHCNLLADLVTAPAETRAQALTDAEEARRLHDELVALAAPLHAEYERCHWTRYYRVTNGNGHIHSSTLCDTCFPTTLFAWMTELSGLTTAQLVERVGEVACTVCFPEAPVLKGWGKVGAEKRQAQADRAAKREAEKCPGAGEPRGYVIPKDRWEWARILRERTGEVLGDPASAQGLNNIDVERVCSHCGKRVYKDRSGADAAEYHKPPKRLPRFMAVAA